MNLTSDLSTILHYLQSSVFQIPEVDVVIREIGDSYQSVLIKGTRLEKILS